MINQPKKDNSLHSKVMGNLGSAINELDELSRTIKPPTDREKLKLMKRYFSKMYPGIMKDEKLIQQYLEVGKEEGEGLAVLNVVCLSELMDRFGYKKPRKFEYVVKKHPFEIQGMPMFKKYSNIIHQHNVNLYSSKEFIKSKECPLLLQSLADSLVILPDYIKEKPTLILELSDIAENKCDILKPKEYINDFEKTYKG